MIKGQIVYLQNFLFSRQTQCESREKEDAVMAGIYGRLPHCTGMNGVNFNHANLDFFNPDAPMYGKSAVC